MSKSTPPKILAVLGIMFAGYLVISPFTGEEPWCASNKDLIYKNVRIGYCNDGYIEEYFLSLAKTECAAEGLSEKDVEAYYLIRAKDICGEKGGKFYDPVETEFAYRLDFSNDGWCKIGKKDYLFNGRELVNEIPAKTEILE